MVRLACLVTLLLCLPACTAGDPCRDAFFRDADGDGYGAPADTVTLRCIAPEGYVTETGDCDDADPAIHPGADEACDGIDHDCDGAPDDRPLTTFHFDQDGDGHGAAAPTMTACFAPAGYVVLGDDCHDTTATISPSRPEDCSPIDRDCDLSVDEDAIDAVSYFFDGDVDGEGTYETRVVSCTQPSVMHVRMFGDCDDTNPARASYKTELRYTGVDEDCNVLTRDDDVDQDGLAFAVDCDDSDPLKGAATPTAPYFTEVSASAGLTAPSAVNGAWQTACPDVVHAAGAAVGDYDGDGDLDLFLVRVGARSQLLQNDGSGVFTDVSEATGVVADGAYGAAVFFDLGGDGDLDLYVAAAGIDRSLLFVQTAPGAFSEEAVARGADLPTTVCAHHYSVSAADIDGDDDIDLLVPTWSMSAGRNAVLIDDGTGHFTRGEAALGLSLNARFGFGMLHADVTGDGRKDVPFIGDYGTSGLFTGQANGTFLETTSAAHVGTDENGMGTDLADYDGDGDLDWFVTSIFAKPRACEGMLGISCSGNRLYRNDGAGVFSDVTDAMGVRDGGWGWGAAFFDMDDDGTLELAHTNGFHAPAYEFDPTRLFVRAGGAFVERACDHGLRAYGQGRAFVPFDMDRDGDLDVLLTEHGAAPRLFENPGIGHAYLGVRLVDMTSSNRNGLGATVYMRRDIGSTPVRREVNATSTYAGVGPAEAHFGLGNHVGSVMELRVVWPDGEETTHTNVSSNQAYSAIRSP